MSRRDTAVPPARYLGTGRVRPALVALAIAALVPLLLVAGALIPGGGNSTDLVLPGRVPGGGLGSARAAAGDLNGRVEGLQARLRAVPTDAPSWASLGLTYVERARVTADPSYYPKAQGALERSLSIESSENFAAHAGLSALASGRHDFATARTHARRGLSINPSSAVLYGALADAETQLGNYPAAFDAIQRMVDLAPNTPSLARASYAWELRGDIAQARANMARALDDAVTSGDRAFSRYHLGGLAFNAGDPVAALDQFTSGLEADPGDVRLLEGRAKARAALGQVDAAIADYRAVVDRLPEPGYLIALGELLESAGRAEEAAAAYGLLDQVVRLFEANGVVLDVELARFQADHGDPSAALRYAEAGIAARQFMDVQDAYAWALHVNGRDAEAVVWSDRALSLGIRSSLFEYHAGMIRRSLGDTDGARRHLSRALDLNRYFSPLWAPVARNALSEMGVAP